MVSKLPILALLATISLAESPIPRMSLEQKSAKNPKLKNFGYNTILGNNEFGMGIDLNTDVGASYRVGWGSTGDYIYSNPVVYFLAGGHNKVIFNFWWFRIFFKLDLIGYQFTGTDLQLAFDANTYNEFCYGASMYHDILDIDINFGWDINECLFGMFGIITGSWKECQWRRYEPAQSLFSYGLFEDMNYYEEYIPWTCRGV